MFRARSRGTRSAAVAVCTSALLAPWLLGPSASDAQTPPASPCPASPAPAASPASQAIVACVGSQQITVATFEHWSTVARAGEGPRVKQHFSERKIVEEVMPFLLSDDWLLGEAAALDVHVSPAVVRRKFDKLRSEQFPKRNEFRAFLRRSRQTVADLLLRVEMQMLANRIQRKVMAGVRGKRAREQALTRFAFEFRKRWEAQTFCAAQYAVRECGHVQAVL
jgi:hypothetical protein